MPLPEGKGYGKGFQRLRRLVNFPLKGEVSNHKGISDELPEDKCKRNQLNFIRKG